MPNTEENESNQADEHAGHNHAPGEHHHHDHGDPKSGVLLNRDLIQSDSNRVYVPIEAEHAERFGQLIVSNTGRTFSTCKFFSGRYLT